MAGRARGAVVVRWFLCIVCGDVARDKGGVGVKNGFVRRCLGGCAGIARREADRGRGGDGPGSIFSFHKREKDFIFPVHGCGGTDVKHVQDMQRNYC